MYLRVIVLILISVNFLFADAFKFSLHELAFQVSINNKINIIVDPGIDDEQNFYFYNDLDTKLSRSAFELLLKENGYQLKAYDNLFYVTKQDVKTYSYQHIKIQSLPFSQIQSISQFFDINVTHVDSDEYIVRYFDTQKYFKFTNMIHSLTRRKQISLEGEIIAVNESDLKDIGVDFTSVANAINQVGSASVGVLSNLNNNSLFQQFVKEQAVTNIGDITVFINFLKEYGDAKVVTRPNMIIRDGEQSQFKAGKQIRIIESSTDSVKPSGEYAAKQYKMLDVGLSFTCKANILEDYSVLDFSFEVSELEVYKPLLDELIITSKSFKSIFSVADGETIAIAGLTSQQEESIVSETPLLSSIPLIGDWLFTHTYKKKQTVSYLVYFKVSVYD